MDSQERHTVMRCAGVLIAIALTLPLAAVWAQEEEESAEVMRELREVRSRSQEAYNKEVQAFIQQELPQGLALLESAVTLSERRGARLETQFKVAEIRFKLAEATRELQESQRHYPQAYDRIKKRFESEIATHLLANRYRLTEDDAVRRDLAQQLESALVESFEMIHGMLKDESREAGPNYTQMRRRVRDREKYRAQIIQRRKSELLYDYDPFSWH